MGNEFKSIFGAWTQAIGTVVSAIGSTPFPYVSEQSLTNIDLIGNVMQGTGNALQADEVGEPLEKLGNEIQAIGNSSCVTGIIIDFNEETKQKLIITGNWLQALGGLTVVGDQLKERSNGNQTLILIGNLLQAIGNSLQATSVTYELKDKEIMYGAKGNQGGDTRYTQTLHVSGSWIQAVGSVMCLIGQLKEES
ncbi:hypothetical protein SAMN05192533_103235 [Mesobacillus persicus]|uniref:Uncharacterized protein n=1 Tax=Mesobacillus persicus TaxID=930146 RepID=A0A1H7Z259_9BACI|nr:hypothetical protein [Mesobacillus persicus]SEM52315.1 hypothetical protein SAMN05192533_103235 [Mesobacillus persicus]